MFKSGLAEVKVMLLINHCRDALASHSIHLQISDSQSAAGVTVLCPVAIAYQEVIAFQAGFLSLESQIIN